jgi:integration host factor subunit alpha
MLTITRAHIAEMIYTQVGLSRNESADLLEDVLERVATHLEKGESVKISGSGRFLSDKKAAGSGAIRRPAKKCPSCRAVSSCSGQAMC